MLYEGVLEWRKLFEGVLRVDGKSSTGMMRWSQGFMEVEGLSRGDAKLMG